MVLSSSICRLKILLVTFCLMTKRFLTFIQTNKAIMPMLALGSLATMSIQIGKHSVVTDGLQLFSLFRVLISCLFASTYSSFFGNLKDSAQSMCKRFVSCRIFILWHIFTPECTSSSHVTAPLPCQAHRHSCKLRIATSPLQCVRCLV